MTTPSHTLNSISNDLERLKNEITQAHAGHHAENARLLAEKKQFEADPASLSPEHAKELFADLSASNEICALLDPQSLDYQLRQTAERYFVANVVACTEALTGALEAKLQRRPGFIESLRAKLTPKNERISTLAGTPEELENIMLERDQTEEHAADIERRVRHARQSIRYYEENPSPENCGAALGAIGMVSYDPPK